MIFKFSIEDENGNVCAGLTCAASLRDAANNVMLEFDGKMQSFNIEYMMDGALDGEIKYNAD